MLSVGRCRAAGMGGDVPDVAANIHSEVTTDGARGGVGGASCAQDHAAHLDDILALPDHAYHRAGGHVRDQTREELLLLQILVVRLHVLLAGMHHLQTNQLETLLLKALDDLTDQSTLDAVRLYHLQNGYD